jgi:hypothetical protein
MRVFLQCFLSRRERIEVRVRSNVAAGFLQSPSFEKGGPGWIFL